MRNLLTGNQLIIQAALDAGAQAFFGYPITPATGILEEWIEVKNKLEGKRNLAVLQTEDEMSAGFAMIGAILTGKKAFTATSGPGNVLMQDAFSMAEAMRIPTVAFIMQRGGPSTGTVVYSQSETTLTCFGGNGEGIRIVYSAGSLEELYRIGKKAFNTAWKYRFPTFVLADGYQAKMRGSVAFSANTEKNISSCSFFESQLNGKMPQGSFIQTNEKNNSKKKYTSLRNCYDQEEELGAAIQSSMEGFDSIRQNVVEYEEINSSSKILVIAHGIVGFAVKEALIKNENKIAGLFRPITLSPFPSKELRATVKNKNKIILLESANGQMGRMAKESLMGMNIKIEEKYKPGEGFYPEEIIKIIKHE